MMLLLCSQKVVLMPNADQNRVPSEKLQSLEAQERCCYCDTVMLLRVFVFGFKLNLMKGTPKVVLRKGRLMQPKEEVKC